MKTIDNSNLACPQPVINTKKAIEQGLPVISIVDNEIAKENVVKLCNKMGVEAKVDIKSSKFEIFISGVGGIVDHKVSDLEGVYLITSKVMGKGDDKLGEALMKAFIYTLSQREQAPRKIMLLNSGVFLAAENSQVISQLEEMKGKGTEITSCGTCLDFYQLEDKLAVGSVTNMYDIVETLATEKVINI